MNNEIRQDGNDFYVVDDWSLSRERLMDKIDNYLNICDEDSFRDVVDEMREVWQSVNNEVCQIAIVKYHVSKKG
jgi:hypothetical protein